MAVSSFCPSRMRTALGLARTVKVRFGQTGLGVHPIHGGMVDTELTGNGAHPPLLHIEVTQDLCFGFRT